MATTAAPASARTAGALRAYALAGLLIAGAVAYSKRKPIAMSADDGSDGVSRSEQEKVHA